MRKFAVRWWVDTEFLGRREDHNIDTAALLLENYGLSARCGSWSYGGSVGWDPAIRGPKTSTVLFPKRTSRLEELQEHVLSAEHRAVSLRPKALMEPMTAYHWKTYFAACAEYERASDALSAYICQQFKLSCPVDL